MEWSEFLVEKDKTPPVMPSEEERLQAEQWFKQHFSEEDERHKGLIMRMDYNQFMAVLAAYRKQV